uniref:2-hydroxyacyl-CoA lyase n=1 Tax=Glossina palpalis gambiensis TaxID=67801 RepID=A0A1B0C4G2_9MUSC
MNAVNFHFDNNREWWYQLNEQCQQKGAIINDLGRAVLLNTSSRHRLHAEDDSALGFSAMNLETMVRCKLPIVIIIVNNNGIYGGFDQETFNNLRSDGD